MSLIERDQELEIYEERAGGARRMLTDVVLRAPLTRLHPAAPVTVAPAATAREAVELMNRHRFGCVVVIGADGAVAGIFTERDVLRKVAASGKDPAGLSVGDLMTAKPECLPAGATIGFALNKMFVHGYRHIPIVDEKNRPTGIISVRDIVGYLVEYFPEDVINLPPDPFRQEAHAEPDGA
jgi:CBS domain-containing protein